MFVFVATDIDLLAIEPRCRAGTEGTPVPTRVFNLFRLEHRWPLFYIRSQPFFGVFALEEQLLILAFYG